jgi:5-methylcytosine-specific restriction endonuclease McrA
MPNLNNPNKKNSKLNLFKKLANLDENTGECRIVDKSEFIDEYSCLQFTNGGDWCRRTSFSKPPNNLKIATATSTGKINLLWDADNDEKASVEEYFKTHCNFVKSSGASIKYIKSFGKFECSNTTRAIRKDILEYYKMQSCVNCGSKAELQCDHKNGLYNDTRVLNLETQTLEDFQSLCRHCNCQKRQIEKKTRETGKRYGATNIPHLRPFGIDFIEGDMRVDINNPNALRGTYWYDPIAFTKYIHSQLPRQSVSSDTNLIDTIAQMSING